MIPSVLKNLLGSEKGVVALALLVGATVLTAVGTMTIQEWQEYSIWIFGIYTGGKTAQGVAAQIGKKDPSTDTTTIDPSLLERAKPTDAPQA